MKKTNVKNSGWIKLACAFVLTALLCLGLATVASAKTGLVEDAPEVIASHPSGDYTEPFELTLSLGGSHSGWSFCYTTDGSMPVNTFNTYGNKVHLSHCTIPISGKTTICVAAFRAIYNKAMQCFQYYYSKPYTFHYHFPPEGTTHIGDFYFTVPGGTYEDPQSVTISHEGGWDICYTTDGSEPYKWNRPEYIVLTGTTHSSPVTVDVSKSGIIKVVAYRYNAHEAGRYSLSAVTAQTYQIKSSDSVQVGQINFSPAADTYTEAQTVTLACPSGWNICYSTDGSDPMNSNRSKAPTCTYTGPFTLAQNTTIRARAYRRPIDLQAYIYGDLVEQTYLFSTGIESTDPDAASGIVFSPQGGTFYKLGLKVHLSTKDSNIYNKIYYTTDGSDPRNTNYCAPEILLSTGQTKIRAALGIQVYVAGTGFISEWGDVAEQTYNLVQAPYLTVETPVFDPVTEGYDRPEAKGIRITNSGSATATIRSVQLSDGDTEAFSLSYRVGLNVPADKTNDSACTIQPVGGLKPGDYFATVTVTYDDGETASADVTFTVNPKPVLPVLETGANTVALEAVNEAVPYSFTPAETGYYAFVCTNAGVYASVELYDGDTRIAPAAGVNPSVRCIAPLEGEKEYTVWFTALQTAGDATPAVQRLYPVVLDPETEHGGFSMDTGHAGYAVEDGNIFGMQVAGETVSLIPEPEEGYTMTEITVVDVYGEPIADTTGGWVMPEQGVIIHARFDRAYTLSFEGDDNVYFNMFRIGGLGGGAFRPVPVLPGQTVQLSWECEELDYIPDTFSVVTAGGAAVPFTFRRVEEMNRQMLEFEMPEEDVTASVTSCLFTFDRADFVLPADTRVIEDNAFDGDLNISVVVIPSDCERIGKEAFKGCKNLERILIPADCTVGEDAFIGCDWVLVYGAENSSAWAYCQAHPENTLFMPE